MEEFITNWNREELHAYIMLYCAHADFVITPEEKKYIKSTIGREKYHTIQKEFDADTDYQQIQKIQATISRFNYSKDEIDRLFSDIKEIFIVDGTMDILEKNIYRGLQHLLK